MDNGQAMGVKVTNCYRIGTDGYELVMNPHRRPRLAHTSSEPVGTTTPHLSTSAPHFLHVHPPQRRCRSFAGRRIRGKGVPQVGHRRPRKLMPHLPLPRLVSRMRRKIAGYATRAETTIRTM